MEAEKALERITPEEAGISSRQVKKCIEELMHETTQMHGFMAARHGKVFAECWWAPFNSEMVHSNHSFGKSYTATAIGIAVTEKKLSLDEKMVDIFKDEIEERKICVPELTKKITVRHVLSMTNGHAANPSIEGDWIANYFTAAIEYEPGTRFLYNTSGACMLAAVVKKKTGENVKDYLTPRLFEKIGINAERFVWLKWPNGIDAEPATFATTEDNLRLAILYMNNGRWNDEQIVSEEFIREALSVRIKTDEAPEQKDGRCGYGYQLWACSIPGVYRFDGGQGQYGIICGFTEDGQDEDLEYLLDWLGATGIGGKVSSGYGKFHVVDKIYLNEPFDDQTEWMYHALSAEHAPYLLLSTSLPQTDELDNALEGASFQLVRRSGFMASDRVETPLKKKTQYALSAGSVLQNRYQGALYDVGLSDVHPVYRYSKPIFMGVTL